ncbi:hypothetical protein [Geomicrobium sp. JCM 19037]|nr:hypothetical protein [Geomicrobium sp. JCM 19037]
MFVYNNEILMIGTTFMESFGVIITSIIGVVMLGIAAEGYIFGRLNIVFQILMAGGSLLFLHPALITDAIAVTILLAILLFQWFIRSKKKPPHSAEA